MVAWNQSWWEYLDHGSWQILKVQVSIFKFPVNIAQHWHYLAQSPYSNFVKFPNVVLGSYFLFQSKDLTLHSLLYQLTLFKSGTFPPPFFAFLELDILKTSYFVECTRGLWNVPWWFGALFAKILQMWCFALFGASFKRHMKIVWPKIHNGSFEH